MYQFYHERSRDWIYSIMLLNMNIKIIATFIILTFVIISRTYYYHNKTNQTIKTPITPSAKLATSKPLEEEKEEQTKQEPAPTSIQAIPTLVPTQEPTFESRIAEERVILNLTTQNISSSMVRIKADNSIAPFQLEYPSEFLSVLDNYSISLDNYDPNPDYSEGISKSIGLLIYINKYNNSSFFEEVKKEYTEFKENEGGAVNLNDIKPFKVSGKQGYHFSCEFLIDQDCRYIQLDNSHYLYILYNHSPDTVELGLKAKGDKILESIKFN